VGVVETNHALFIVSMSPTGLSLGRVLSSRACLCFTRQSLSYHSRFNDATALV